jgi:hypothetical protein
MFFVFVPIFVVIFQGQDSILFLLLCCLAHREMTRARDFRAGCLVALALLKFQIVLLPSVLLAARGGHLAFFSDLERVRAWLRRVSRMRKENRIRPALGSLPPPRRTSGAWSNAVAGPHVPDGLLFV